MTKDRIVTTYDGTEAKRSNCRRYQGGYYEIGRQCFKMPDGRFYRIDSGKVIYNYSTNEYVFSNVGLVNGIIDTHNGEIIRGYFSRDNINNVVVNDRLLAISEDILDSNFVEDLSSGRYYHKSKLPSDFYKIRLGGSYSKETDYTAGYRQSEISKTFNDNFKPDVVKPFWKSLPSNLTVGIEYETYAGKIPEEKCMKSGLIPVKDGSLRRDGGMSFEYATIILNKNNVMPAIKAHDMLLNRYCKKSTNESLHVHIGGYRPSKEMIVSMYRILLTIQDEVFKMFPMFIKKTSVFKSNRKDYCKPMPKVGVTFKNLDLDYKKIIYNISDGNIMNSDFDDFGSPHPSDQRGNQKWNIRSRYRWCNLVPFIFKGTGTIEFRLHTNTFNKDKVAAWLFITSAIVEFAYKFKDDSKVLEKISLNNIIDSVYTDKVLNSYLKEYIKYRKNLMRRNHNVYRDFIGKLDVEQDHLEDFKFPIKELV